MNNLKKIKVVHLISSLSVGGTEMMLYKLLSKFDQRNFENVVICMIEIETVGDYIKILNVPVYSLGMRRGRPTISGLLRLLQLLKKLRPHIIQTWLYHADLLGLIAGKLIRIPAIIWNVRCANMDMKRYSKLSEVVVKILAKLSPLPNAIIVNSATGRKYHEGIGYNSKKWIGIPNGFDLKVLRPDMESYVKLRAELGIPANSIIIGLIARYDPMKDHNNFLHAASLLLKGFAENNLIHFVLAGRNVNNSNIELVKLISELGLCKQTHLLGERQDVQYITAALDLATSSSYGEGFQNTIGEAMSCGVPCVVTDVGDSALIVGETGRVVPPRMSAALAEAWRELIEMGGERRKELGLKARQRIIDNFSLDAVVKKYEDLYIELTSSRSTKRTN